MTHRGPFQPLLFCDSESVRPGFDCCSVPSPSSFPTVTNFYAPCVCLCKPNLTLFQNSFGNSLLTLTMEGNHQLVLFSTIRCGQTPFSVLGIPFPRTLHTHVPL